MILAPDETMAVVDMRQAFFSHNVFMFIFAYMLSLTSVLYKRNLYCMESSYMQGLARPMDNSL